MFKNSKLLTLFFTMMVMMLGFGIIIPIMPFYLEQFGGGGREMGMVMAVFSIMQFLFSPFWGNLSDRYGRKRIMLIGVLGNGLSLIAVGLVNSYWQLFLLRAVGGLFSAATLPTAMAYISDSTTAEERGGGMGVIGAAMGVGMVLGPGLGGWLAGDSLSTPFFLGGGLSLLSMLLVQFVLPESLPLEARVTHGRRARGPQIGSMLQALAGPIGFLLFMAFLVNFALASFEGVFGLYADQRFGYGPSQVGGILVVVGLVSSLVQGALTGPATRRFGEPLTINLSLAASALGFVLMLLAGSSSQILLTVGFFVFANAMLRPAIMSLTSKLSKGGQGAAMGLNNSFQSLGRVAGPLWAGFMFDLNLSFPYISGAIIMLAALAYGAWQMRGERLQAQHSVPPVKVAATTARED
jgi:DHA1 family multidrug resistance protein-like MFS transporter